LLHFVGQAGWSDAAVLAKVRELVLPSIEREEAITAWIIDDTGIPKKGVHSVGVARQYCGRLGKQDNCQVAVTLSVANHTASLPVAYRLFLPESWANDPVRRTKVGIPPDVTFQSKPQIAIDQIRQALADGLHPGAVLADAGYGNGGEFRAAVTEMGLLYTVGIQSNVWLLVEWPDGEAEPTKYWLSTLPEETEINAMVDMAKLRWRIERDYQDLKSELGLAQFEGRGWRGFHHHATLTIAAYGFLIRERAAFPPSGTQVRKTPSLSERPLPRGAADPTRAPRPKLNRHNA